MSNINYKFYIQELYVKQFQNTPNAVARVRWVCVLKRGRGKLFAGGLTDLNEPTPGAFISIAELEAQQVLDWVVQKEGGSVWVSQFIDSHETHMQAAEKEAELEAWHIPLLNPIRFDPDNV